jgi:hypothetical protein
LIHLLNLKVLNFVILDDYIKCNKEFIDKINRLLEKNREIQPLRYPNEQRSPAIPINWVISHPPRVSSSM